MSEDFMSFDTIPSCLIWLVYSTPLFLLNSMFAPVKLSQNCILFAAFRCVRIANHSLNRNRLKGNGGEVPVSLFNSAISTAVKRVLCNNEDDIIFRLFIAFTFYLPIKKLPRQANLRLTTTSSSKLLKCSKISFLVNFLQKSH